LALVDKNYPKRLAFLFLEDICREFQNDLQQEHGDDWLRQVETVGRQYAFIKFDRIIQKKRREYADASSSANTRKLNDDLHDIHNVMRKTIDDVLDRGQKLEDVSEISKNLVSDSKKYKFGAKKLAMMAYWKQWAPMLALGLLAVIILGMRYYL
jgi:vesicle transport protein SEC22